MSDKADSENLVITRHSVHDYLSSLAAREPTPGGGSAAALAGALAAGLSAMVANYTIGNKKHAAIAEDVEERLNQCRDSLRTLEGLVQKDIDAYGVVGAGFGMPRSTQAERAARSAHIQQASVAATEVLFDIADACLDVGKQGLWLAKHGNANLIADSVSAVVLAEAALQGSVATIKSSLGFIKNQAVVAAMRKRLGAYVSMESLREEALSLIE